MTLNATDYILFYFKNLQYHYEITYWRFYLIKTMKIAKINIWDRCRAFKVVRARTELSQDRTINVGAKYQSFLQHSFREIK